MVEEKPTKKAEYKVFDERIYAMWKSNALSQVDIAAKLKIHVNTVARAIKRQQLKEAALMELGEA
ncbi:hypothetical protein [Vibrio cholerae]|uniref:hypothetical protein n=1 Tax=Vibrio cholerae TaxID=666 RepID=UPI000E0B051A|nr:hypothetical protein [Vibrio cholerae]